MFNARTQQSRGRCNHFQNALWIALICLAASGCASKYGSQTTNVNYYKDCYDPIAQLREAESDFNKTVVAGAVIGAVGGALIGGLASGKPQGVIAGAAAGGLAGGALGYAAAKQNQIKDDRQRLASYRKDIGADLDGLDRAMAAATVATDCYDKQFQANIEKFKAGQVSKQEFTDRYQEIKSGMAEASKILGSVSESAKKKEEQYQAALSSEAKKAGRPVPKPVEASPVVAAVSDPAATPEKPEPSQPAPVQVPPAQTEPKKEPAKPQTAKAAPSKPKTVPVSETKSGQKDELANMAEDLHSYKNKAQSVEDRKAEITNRMSNYNQTVSDLLG